MFKTNNNFSATTLLLLLLSTQVLTASALSLAPSEGEVTINIPYAPDMGIMEVAKWNREMMTSLEEARDVLTAQTTVNTQRRDLHRVRDPKLQNLSEAYSAIEDAMEAFKANSEGVYLGEGLVTFQKFMDDNTNRLFEENNVMMTETLNLLGHGIRRMGEIKSTGSGILTGIQGGLKLVDGLLHK